MVRVVLVFERGDDEETDHIESKMDDLPRLGDRFTYMERRWQVHTVEPEEPGFPAYVYLNYEDPAPRA